MLLWEVEGQRPDPPGPRWGGGAAYGEPWEAGGRESGSDKAGGPLPRRPRKRQWRRGVKRHDRGACSVSSPLPR